MHSFLHQIGQTFLLPVAAGIPMGLTNSISFWQIRQVAFRAWQLPHTCCILREGKGRGQTRGISEEADDLVEQGPVQHMVPPAAFPYPGEGGKVPFPLLCRGLEERALPALSSTIFAFFISLSLVGRAGRSHCNIDIYCPSLEYWLFPSQTASTGWEQGSNIHCSVKDQHLQHVCSALISRLLKVGKWEGESISLQFLSFPASPLQVLEAAKPPLL